MLLVASLDLFGSLMLLFGVYLQIDPRCLFIFSNVGFPRSRGDKPEDQVRLRKLRQLLTRRCSRPTIFECPLGMAILELLVLYLMHRDGYDEPMHSLFYILVLD